MEIIGKVQNDLSVRVMASTDFGPEGNIGECEAFDRAGRESHPGRPLVFMLTIEPDFNAVEAVVDVTHRYPEMFYPKEQ